ncbi:follistatin-related protein 4-like [Hydractinia symbiolongicarpus]|uniref:follistatin-related protein 4-like n=1 Tax=Hydractinia symbiolongicarpus TaxID=13093 RepID=UPI00254BEFA0|nr:follistatin-related protein 4-like [Hydractinia symbiolongicarpus]
MHVFVSGTKFCRPSFLRSHITTNIFSPTPLISWYKDGVKVLPSSGSAAGNIMILSGNMRLRIVPVRTTDVGVYKCVARNSLGEDSKEGVLLVHRETSWKIKLRNVVKVQHNDVIILWCSASGYPAVQYSLYHNDTLLKRYTLF